MAKQKDSKGITVKKADDMPEWYAQICLKCGLAEHAPIKGCMVIKPYGYALWQAIQDYFNPVIKKHGVENAYFPMFIPESFFKREAEHAKGFSPEVAWIQPKTEDKQKYAIRPTSETIIYDSFAKWIRSWRDLPLRINQWCNICRWEVQDCKMFLRTREFLWQEGHCVYETEDECEKETLLFLDEYRKLSEEYLAMPAVMGRKTEKEKFAGALKTYTIETLMPDGKALQLGTSHNLGQGFGKAFGLAFEGKDEKKHVPWQSSWGISTRMIGAIVMMHSDDQGLVLPPKIAPIQAVVVPILFDKTKEKVLKAVDSLEKDLKDVRVKVDAREHYSAGYKFNEWEMKGVPLRIEIGPRDLEKNECIIARRDTSKKETVKLKDVAKHVEKTLEDMQKKLFAKAKKNLKDRTIHVKSWKEFLEHKSDGKLMEVSFCGSKQCEAEVKEKTKVTSRCIPLGNVKPEEKKCFHCSKNAEFNTLFARNY
jgi:prolyl-tRNA synthetase